VSALDPFSIDPFSVEPYRAASVRRAVVRRAPRPMLVLGSTQSAALLDQAALRRADVSVARRRTGGGAVLVGPDDPVWLDLWVPRGDPLWEEDAARAMRWVGEWWSASLAQVGFGPTEVAEAAGPLDPVGRTVCFAALGAGEVHRAGRKVVGVAQWRSRQGALIHSAAYRRWLPEPLLDLFDWKGADPAATSRRLLDAAVGFGEPPAGPAPGALTGALLGSLPGEWDVSVDPTG
jgi:lipoate---protein ligase